MSATALCSWLGSRWECEEGQVLHQGEEQACGHPNPELAALWRIQAENWAGASHSPPVEVLRISQQGSWNHFGATFLLWVGQQALKKGRLISPPPVRLLLYLSFLHWVPQIMWVAWLKIFIYPVSLNVFVSALPFSLSPRFRIWVTIDFSLSSSKSTPAGHLPHVPCPFPLFQL